MAHDAARYDDAMTGGGSAGALRPDWYHEDNLFPSRERMDEVHAPIVDLAVQTLGRRAGQVLDLGCGNGALLAKLHARNASLTPFGIDVEPARIEHAHVLLPDHARRLVTGDMFSPQLARWDDERFVLALITPRRCQEGGPDRTRALLDWLRPRVEHLLVYGYGRSLTEFGDLAGFARQVGIQLTDARPGIRASLAASY